MLKSLIITLAGAAILLPQALAKECDNFTNRDLPVHDALEALDARTNELIDAAVGRANSSKNICDRRVLFAALAATLGATPIGVLESWAEKTDQLERLQTDPLGPDSVYRGFNKLKYPLTAVSGIDNSIRLAGHVVGTDKLGHFMAEGLHTYRIWRGKDGSLEKAMAWGIHTEESYYGLWTSGVKAFGDLSANYAGAQFWNAILDTDNPYFTCRLGEFEKIRSFTWKDYVTDAWDEAINCSQFTHSMVATVRRNFARKGIACPTPGTEQLCRGLVSLPDSRWFVSPVCFALASKADLTAAQADALLLEAGGGRSGE